MKLAEKRESMGKRQEDIARKVGISRSGYANIEAGVRRPSVEVAKKIAVALGFDWTLFYEDDETEQDGT